jgi:SOS-response transcriptional repressor LexA
MSDLAFDPDLVRTTMKARGVSQALIAQRLRLTSQSAVSNMLKGIRRVTAQEARAIYEILGLPTTPTPNVLSVPIIGITSAGMWREAITMPLGQMPVPSGVAGAKSFALEVTGDSMDLLIEEGGFVVIDPDRKELVAGKCYLIANGDHDATVKMYQRDPARFVPCSRNPEHKAFMAADTDFAVLGRVVWKGAPV